MLSRIGGMSSVIAAAAFLAAALLSPPVTHAGASKTGFGFHATLSGFPSGIVHLTGGGSYAVPQAPGSPSSVHSGGGFRCVDDVSQGPLTGCAAGEGVRWDAIELLPAVAFKCNGGDDMSDIARTDAHTIVLVAKFYRAGDGVHASPSSAPMFVSDQDQRPDLPGNQNVWIAGVGCGSGVVNFSH
jgi:hypothetical protein